MRSMEDLRQIINEANTLELAPEDLMMSEEQANILEDIKVVLERLSTHKSKMGGLDVRDVKTSLESARKRLEKNVAYVTRLSKIT